MLGKSLLSVNSEESLTPVIHRETPFDNFALPSTVDGQLPGAPGPDVVPIHYNKRQMLRQRPVEGVHMDMRPTAGDEHPTLGRSTSCSPRIPGAGRGSGYTSTARSASTVEEASREMPTTLSTHCGTCPEREHFITDLLKSSQEDTSVTTFSDPY